MKTHGGIFLFSDWYYLEEEKNCIGDQVVILPTLWEAHALKELYTQNKEGKG